MITYKTSTRISEFIFRIKELKKDYTIRDIIKYYSLPFYIVFKRHNLEYWSMCGKIFARMLLLKTDQINGLVVKNKILRFPNRSSLEAMIQWDVVYSMTCQNKMMWNELATLCDVFVMIANEATLTSYFSTHQKVENGFHYAVGGVLLQFMRDKNQKAEFIFRSILKELENLDDQEFRFIQTKIYRETIKEFNSMLTACNEEKHCTKSMGELFRRYIQQTISVIELEQLNNWIDQKPERRKYFENGLNVDVEGETMKIIEKIDRLNLRNRSNGNPKFLKVV